MSRPFIERAQEFWESEEGRKASRQIDAEVKRASESLRRSKNMTADELERYEDQAE